MTITKCDRCGEPIEHEPPEFYRVTVRISSGCVANMRQDFDLCSTCRNKLVVWIRGDLEPKWTSSTSTRRSGDD